MQLEFSFFRVETKSAFMISFQQCLLCLQWPYVVCMTVYIRISSMHLYLKLYGAFAILFLVNYLGTDGVICFIWHDYGPWTKAKTNIPQRYDCSVPPLLLF